MPRHIHIIFKGTGLTVNSNSDIRSYPFAHMFLARKTRRLLFRHLCLAQFHSYSRNLSKILQVRGGFKKETYFITVHRTGSKRYNYELTYINRCVSTLVVAFIEA